MRLMTMVGGVGVRVMNELTTVLRTLGAVSMGVVAVGCDCAMGDVGVRVVWGLGGCGYGCGGSGLRLWGGCKLQLWLWVR
ncbi:hypothetical protein RIF29_16867 [Crotalaria pallida]|uniref:Uncharacterized protein n=1 Tax=Crotalaria pallida TaxID=3830 RepID=A0AAN9FLW2_CROPI